VDCLPVSRYRGVSLINAESAVGNAVHAAVDLFRSGCCTTKKWTDFKVPSQSFIVP
jgi:hypothetical protein